MLHFFSIIQQFTYLVKINAITVWEINHCIITDLTFSNTFHLNNFFFYKTGLTQHFLLKCLYQARKESGHVFLC